MALVVAASRDVTSEFMRIAQLRARDARAARKPKRTHHHNTDDDGTQSWREWWDRVAKVRQGLIRTHAVMIEFAPAYLSSGRFVSSSSSAALGSSRDTHTVTEDERDEYEQAMDKSLDATARALEELSNVLPPASSGYHKYSATAHRVTMLLVLQRRLKHLRAVFTQQQLSRAKAAWAQSELLSAPSGTTTAFDRVYAPVDDDRDDSDGPTIASIAGAAGAAKPDQSAKQRAGFQGFEDNRDRNQSPNKSVGRDARGMKHHRSAIGIDDVDGDAWGGVEDELDAAQIKVFEKENAALVEQLKTEIDAVQKVERNVHQLIAMMDTFNQHLVEQQGTLREVGLDVEVSMTNVESAVPQLESAKKHGSELARRFSAFVVAAAVALLAVDWVTY
jgi:hypothetical protein